MAEDWLDEYEAFPRYYANTVRTQGTGYDFAIDFGFLHGSGEEPVEWLARVVMSWEEALTVRDFLSRAIEDYEQAVGTIRDVEPRGDDADSDSNGNPVT